MKTFNQMMRCFIVVMFFISGCAYRYYIGLHGPSVQRFPEVHGNVKQDHECLECHHPENKFDDAPPTTHPDFTGCLKCHNDALK